MRGASCFRCHVEPLTSLAVLIFLAEGECNAQQGKPLASICVIVCKAPQTCTGWGFVRPAVLHQPRKHIWESRCEWTGRGRGAVCVTKECEQHLADLHLSWIGCCWSLAGARGCSPNGLRQQQELPSLHCLCSQ